MTIPVPEGIAEALDLPRAWRRVWKNKVSAFVIPGIVYTATQPRSDVFLEQLARELQSREYRPTPIRVVNVVKPNLTLRPGAVLNLKDRVLYQALADSIAESSTGRLLTQPTVFGFTVNPDSTSAQFLLHGGFDAFRHGVASEHAGGHTHILESDIAAYFESVEPRFLQEALLGLDADPRLGDVLIRLLGFWNNLIPIGLPQGPWPSDFLGARIYLDRLDKAMRQRGYRFFRYSDDMRIAGRNRLSIRTGLRDLVIELRAIGLHVQSAKTKLLSPEQVQASLNRLHDRLAAREDLDELLDLDPYGYSSAEDTLEELSEDDIITSENLLGALLEEAFGDGSRPDFELCRTCITGYRRIRSAGGFAIALDLLDKLPALTAELVRYLRAISDQVDARRIRARVMRLLRARDTVYDWQKHWLLHLLNEQRVRAKLSSSNLNSVFDLASDRNANWAVRSLAIRIVGATDDEAKLRHFKDLYPEESDADIRHAILFAVGRLGPAERNSFYRTCEGIDAQTDLVIQYMKERIARRRAASGAA